MKSWGRVGTAIVVGVVLVSACSSSEKSTGSSDTTTTTRPVRVARPAPLTPAELEARIVTNAPADFELQHPEKFDTGPSDLAKAVRDEGNPAVESVLRSEKFVRGYQRIWVGPDNAQILLFVYQFDSSVGASRDYARFTQTLESEPPPGSHEFDVAALRLPEGRAMGVAGKDGDIAAAVIFFTTGVFNVRVNVNESNVDASKLPGLQARATAIAQDQLSRL